MTCSYLELVKTLASSAFQSNILNLIYGKYVSKIKYKSINHNQDLEYSIVLIC